ncbi:SDR family oxidoreductase [Halovenus marina]|uniref:SDR family oxidoreductase n=1 Tax=Halovenus marina TaxID=3396621 RepID=UPI003F55F8FD
MDLDLDGNTALVTASTSGLGKASATALVREGANVTVCGRTPERLERAREQISAAGPGSVLALEADITDADDLEWLVSTTVEEHGGIDHLVTSAGGVPPGSFLEMAEDDWYDAFELLVMSFVRTATLAHPHLADSDAGTIVAITSASVSEPIDNLVLSNSVRRAVHGLVKSMALELAPEIRVNSVLPSVLIEDIDAAIEDALADGDFDSREAVLDAWTADLPLEQVGDPARLGDMVAVLSSDRTNHTTGAAVPVDGGRIRG